MLLVLHVSLCIIDFILLRETLTRSFNFKEITRKNKIVNITSTAIFPQMTICAPTYLVCRRQQACIRSRLLLDSSLFLIPSDKWLWSEGRGSIFVSSSGPVFPFTLCYCILHVILQNTVRIYWIKVTQSQFQNVCI